jgi:DNA-binding NtrC family response regulator
MALPGAVLIVDDDADVRRSARLALAVQGNRVEEAGSPREMDERLTGGATLDVVLLDMNFVVGDRSGTAGLEAMSRIRAFDPTLAIVLMTAYGGVTLAVESLKQGAVDFVLKPWRNEKLLAAINAAAAITAGRRTAENMPLATAERDAIQRALRRFQGNISAAAAALGVSRAALYRRMSKYEL